MHAPELAEDSPSAAGPVPAKIPVRNIWLLFLYASGLAQFRERFDAEVDQSPDLKSWSRGSCATRRRNAFGGT